MTYHWWDDQGNNNEAWNEGGWKLSTSMVRAESDRWQLLIDLPDLVIGYHYKDGRLLVMWRTLQ